MIIEHAFFGTPGFFDGTGGALIEDVIIACDQAKCRNINIFN